MIAGLFCALFLCSCGAVTGTESLLAAPKMNKRQAQVSQALESALSFSDIVYKYPQRGEYRSPFVFFDISGDGREEAVVFYSGPGGETDRVRAKVLTQDSLGEWAPFYDVTLQSGQIEFIEFQKLISSDSYCMLVGMQGAGRSPSTLAVYSFRENAFPLEVEHQYYSYSIRDFNGDSLAEIAVIARNRTENSFYLTLLQKQGSHIAPGARISLSPDVGSIERLTYGKLWDGGGALYIDELLADGPVATTATEIIRVDVSGLELLAGGEPRRQPDASSTVRDNYEVTFRDEAIYCMDVDGDGTVEVPYPVSLPGTYGNIAEEPPKLIQLMHLQANGFNIERSAVINADAGYLLFFPERWLDGAVTVENRPEISEWRFHTWNRDTQDSLEEILRIRAVQARDSQDLFENYTELGAKGMTLYMAHIPNLENESLSVTEPEAKKLFRLLP